MRTFPNLEPRVGDVICHKADTGKYRSTLVVIGLPPEDKRNPKRPEQGLALKMVIHYKDGPCDGTSHDSVCFGGDSYPEASDPRGERPKMLYWRVERRATADECRRAGIPYQPTDEDGEAVPVGPAARSWVDCLRPRR